MLLPPIYHENIPSSCADYKAIIGRPLLSLTYTYTLSLFLPIPPNSIKVVFLQRSPTRRNKTKDSSEFAVLRRAWKINPRRGRRSSDVKGSELIGKKKLAEGIDHFFEVGNNYSSLSQLELAFHRQNVLLARNLQRVRVKVWTFESFKADFSWTSSRLKIHVGRSLLRDLSWKNAQFQKVENSNKDWCIRGFLISSEISDYKEIKEFRLQDYYIFTLLKRKILNCVDFKLSMKRDLTDTRLEKCRFLSVVTLSDSSDKKHSKICVPARFVWRTGRNVNYQLNLFTGTTAR